MTTDKVKLVILTCALGLFVSCSDSSTGTEPGEPTATTGVLEVTVSTTGDSPDGDGYTVTVGDLDSESININGSTTFSELEEGSYTVELSGLADNCTVDGDNPVSADVTAGETTSVQFGITCGTGTVETPNVGGVIAFTQNVDGIAEIFTMNADGTNKQRLTTNEVDENSPAISPDGTEIAFVRRDGAFDNEIWVMDIDGENPVQLTDNTASDSRPAWSPEGDKIVFESDRNGDSMSLFIMNTDGTNQVAITDNGGNDHSATWSADGIIAFISDRQGDSSADIYQVQPDGTGLEILVDAANDNGINLFDPVWAQDAAHIAYQGYISGGRSVVFIAARDGGNAQSITAGYFHAMQPSWSPDGEYIAFMNLADASKNTTNAIWIIRTDGTGSFRLTDDQGTYSNFPSWGKAVK